MEVFYFYLLCKVNVGFVQCDCKIEVLSYEKEKTAGAVEKENTNMKKGIIVRVGVAVAAVLGFCVVFTGIRLGTAGSYYYVRIDNSKIRENDSSGGVVNFQGNLDYLYTLTAYNEKGKEKEITFGTSRQLREGAYLKLTVSPLRGVVEWREAEYEELSAGVREKLAE